MFRFSTLYEEEAAMQYSIGVDVHRKFSQVCVLDQTGHTVRQSKLYHEDLAHMSEFFHKHTGKNADMAGRGVITESCV